MLRSNHGNRSRCVGAGRLSGAIEELNMTDETEEIRTWLLESGQTYKDLARAEKKWDTEQLKKEFEVIAFLAPFVIVRRISDGVEGSLEFTHDPRWYFDFKERGK